MGDIKDIISDTKFNTLIKNQLYALDETLRLGIEDYARIPLLIQTVHGRATQGHGLFNGESRPEITMDDICYACDIDPKVMRGYRQQIANDTKQNVVDIFTGKKNTLTNRLGEPLGGVRFLDGIKVDADKEFYKCYALGGRMDMNTWRQYTESVYPLTLDMKEFHIGSGKEYLVNKEILRDLNITTEYLSDVAHSEEKIEEYKSIGLIVDNNKDNRPNIENKFIRRAKGLGICDDGAMISSGRKYGTDGMKALFLTDMLDTYTKYNNDEIAGGEDEFLGKMVEKMWFDKYNEELITPEETAEIIYLGAKNNMKIGIHSSSHRYFVQKENNSDIATFMRHENFVRFGEMGNYELGFERLNSKLFYENMDKKFTALNKLGTVDGNDYTVLTK